MFTKLGAFRFVADYQTPITALESALAANADQEIGGSLIVLPEAFNIGKGYREVGDCNHDPSVLFHLEDIASRLNITFVAGLIIKTASGPDPPYSSAYVVDSSGFTLISHKAKPDYGKTPYTPCSIGCDVANPFTRGEIAIGALICVDIDTPRHEAVLKRLKATDTANRILCIPGCLGNQFSVSNITQTSPGCYVIVANSDRWGCKSGIGKDGVVLVLDPSGDENTIILSDV